MRALKKFLVSVIVALLAAIAVLVIGMTVVDDSDGPGQEQSGVSVGEHWHASYTWFVCGEKQANAPTWEGVGVHTHGDGIIHIHPFTASEEGSGASLVKWFEYGGGLLDDDTLRMPGFPDTWENGDECPSNTPDAGAEAEVQIFVNGQKLDDWMDYLPYDGDRIQVVFGPPRDTEVR
jgi:hypothetical protein